MSSSTPACTAIERGCPGNVRRSSTRRASTFRIAQDAAYEAIRSGMTVRDTNMTANYALERIEETVTHDRVRGLMMLCLMPFLAAACGSDASSGAHGSPGSGGATGNASGASGTAGGAPSHASGGALGTAGGAAGHASGGGSGTAGGAAGHASGGGSGTGGGPSSTGGASGMDGGAPSTGGAAPIRENQSCANLPAKCGPSSSDDCCASPLVTGGMFNREGTSDGPATVSDYRLDKYEVTRGRFRAFVAAVVGGWRPPAASGKHVHLNGGKGLVASDGGDYEPGWDPAWDSNLPATKADWDTALSCVDGSDTWSSTPANENRAMACLSWFHSYAFCIWDGGFLPSEAEWRYAALGGSEQRAYPWSVPPDSTTIDCTFANRSLCVPNNGDLKDVGAESPKGDGKWGHSDLQGNVSEWALDWWVFMYVMPCTDCARLPLGSIRDMNGGSWLDDEEHQLNSIRHNAPPERSWEASGVRCARAP